MKLVPDKPFIFDDESLLDVPNIIAERVRELHQKLYGDRWCEHCKQIQPVRTFELAGSREFSTEGTTVTMKFIGAQVCAVCWRSI